MSVFNHFENLFEVTGRDFNQFKQRLLQIEIPVQEIQYGVKANGQYFAILKADRPKKVKKKEPKIEKAEPTKTSEA